MPLRKLTVTQIAHKAGVHPNTVRNWIAAGNFPPPDQKLGVSGWPRWKRETVEKALAYKKVQAEEQ